MNDRHPSGTMTSPAPASDAAASTPYAYGGQEAQYGDFTTYGGYDTGGYATGHATTAYAADPLFGDLQGQTPVVDAYGNAAWTSDGGQSAQHDPYAAQQHTAYAGTGYDTSGYDTSGYDASAYGTAGYDSAGYDSGAYDATAWATGRQGLAAVPPQAAPADPSGQWDASGWQQPAGTADATQHWEWGTQTFETAAYDTTQWNTDGGPTDHAGSDEYGQTTEYEQTSDHEQATEYGQAADHPQATDYGQAEEYDQAGEYDQAAGHDDADPGPQDGPGDTGELPAVTELLEDQEEFTPAARPGGRAASRSRRRSPAKRSALLTVAVPSVCVMGVAGIAAANVGPFAGGDKDTSASASDAQSVKPSAANNKLDAQLKSVSAGADDFADRASRTQERIDLKAEQDAEKKKAAEEAARKERLRPKFAIPVTQKGLSAYFGQAGVNWMSVHTGIDFPVSYGTTVMAATDGVVSTKWNSAYGNMMIVTAKDGTETWYCHLSSYRVAAGTTVKAGDPIAYSGNSGNSTGPHLHFEVRPAGGSPIDPLPWLRSHGLDPT
ncbi:peptidase M23 [Streptomyces mangrovisoli]|uniref:Peptidase M23 n=1 Tax=Streptomyces mangrovisoli TaxID=1428628 RepID=A0A1J4NYJ4_9ACTN|nr:peptidase M23 [Streptomyces mangrovisoli]